MRVRISISSFLKNQVARLPTHAKNFYKKVSILCSVRTIGLSMYKGWYSCTNLLKFGLIPAVGYLVLINTYPHIDIRDVHSLSSPCSQNALSVSDFPRATIVFYLALEHLYSQLLGARLTGAARTERRTPGNLRNTVS